MTSIIRCTKFSYHYYKRRCSPISRLSPEIIFVTSISNCVSLRKSHSHSILFSFAAAAGDTGTTRRKRFHPLRNLRRIFRRRTVSSADATPRQLLAKSQTHIHFATSGCSTTDATLPRTGLGVPITIRADSGGGGGGGGVGGVGAAGFYKRETYRLRDADDLDKEMSDYQRSLSEGRLVDR